MDNKKGINFGMVIIAFILGMAIFKHFNFETYSFKKPALDTVYIIAFLGALYFIFKDYFKREKK